jgi:hypothetical protein
LPFLRFTRDKRGYETTSLVHAERRKGRSRHRILYWFRTPPGVKVGRPALDEDAIRWIEEHNPDITFNWQKILEAQPPAAPVEDGKPRRSRRQKSDRGRQSQRPIRDAVPEPPALSQLEASTPAAVEEDEAEAEMDDEPLAPLGEAELAEALEQITHPEAEEKVEPAAAAVEQVIAHEQLVRLRARYAELQTRITERAGTPERVEALRAQAEPLDPDTWVTEEEARKGMEMFEPKMRELRSTLGLRRRRRSRRGGRRRRRGQTEESKKDKKE